MSDAKEGEKVDEVEAAKVEKTSANPEVPESKTGAEDSNAEVSTVVEETVPLSRKRTRDDFEESQQDDKDEVKERKIAPLKRRKSIIENAKETKDGEEALNDDTKDEPSTEDSKADEEQKEPEDNTKEKVEEEAKEQLNEETNEDKPEEKKTDTKPKFVFGSTTPFGANAFSVVNKNKNVFASENQTGDKPATPSTPSVFGSNSKFGNAFQTAISKESIFDKKEEEKKKENSEEAESKTRHLYKQIDLEVKKMETGEEGEEQIFTCRAKLYALDLSKVHEGWKERGVGNVHVNKTKDSSHKSRIIMRSSGLLKVILNTALSKGLEVVKGMPSSLSSEKFIRITSVEDGKPFQYAIKTGNVDTTDSLFESVTSLIPKEGSDLV